MRIVISRMFEECVPQLKMICGPRNTKQLTRKIVQIAYRPFAAYFKGENDCWLASFSIKQR